MNDLENLLNLHNEVFPMDNGYWVKFEAYQVEVTKAVPHGIRYSLTLLNRLKNMELKSQVMTIFISKQILSLMSLSQHRNS